MINIKQLSNQMELSFWSYIIRLLTESMFLRHLLPAVYDFFRRDNFSPTLRITLMCSLGGFLTGLIMGLFMIYTM